METATLTAHSFQTKSEKKTSKNINILKENEATLVHNYVATNSAALSRERTKLKQSETESPVPFDGARIMALENGR
jgi:hypothetical protein